MSRAKIIFALFCLGSSLCIVHCKKSGPGSGDSGKFLVLSDIHYNPNLPGSPELYEKLLNTDVARWDELLGTSGESSTYCEDTDATLLNSLLSYAGSVESKPDFILIGGDFLGHGLVKQIEAACKKGTACYGQKEDLVLQVMHYVNGAVQNQFPGIPVIPAFGNNDSYEGDYDLKANSPFLTDMLPIWEKYLGAQLTGEDRQTFLFGGYYSFAHPTVPDQQFLVLNDVFFTTRNDGAATAETELEWLDTHLNNGKKSWLLYHIPPGVAGVDGSSFWNPDQDFLKKFMASMVAAQDSIKISFAAHTHFASFRVFNQNDKPFGLVQIVPSVSPVHGNNPSFQVYTYDRVSGDLQDVNIYYLDLDNNSKQSALPDYDQEFGQTELNASAQFAVAEGLLQKRYVDEFIAFFSSNSTHNCSRGKKVEDELGISKYSYRKYACATLELCADDYQNCVDGHPIPAKQSCW